MKIKANNLTTKELANGSTEITVSTSQQVDWNNLKDCELSVEIKKFRKGRSINANNYFHNLCDDIAKHNDIKSTLEEIKHEMVLKYGAVAVDENGEKIYIQLPQSVNVNDYCTYAKFIQESKDTKKPCNVYLLYEHTHNYNTKQMATLIDGVVGEAKELGIETRTPAQLAEIKSLWGK